MPIRLGPGRVVFGRWPRSNRHSGTSICLRSVRPSCNRLYAAHWALVRSYACRFRPFYYGPGPFLPDLPAHRLAMVGENRAGVQLALSTATLPPTNL